MQRRVTIVANGDVVFQDMSGLEANNKDNQWLYAGVKGGTSASFQVGEGQWERIRYQLVYASQQRIPQSANAAKTLPLMTYQVDLLPGLRPRVHAVTAPSMSLGGGTLTLTLNGVSLIAGLQASLTLNPGTTGSLALTAVPKGPAGNLYVLNIGAASGGGSVTVTLKQDGVVVVDLVPASGANDANSIAAQIAGSTMAAKYMTAVGGGTGKVQPISGLVLVGGDGAGQARLDIPGAIPTSGLRVLAVKPGNEQNLITLTLVMNQGGNTVAVSGNNITVNRTGATETIANLVTAINGNASAAALVTASSLGSGSSIGAVAKTYLYGGSGESPTATIGGAVTTISAHSDTQITLKVTGAALTTAGLLNGDVAQIQLVTNYGLVLAGDVPIVT